MVVASMSPALADASPSGVSGPFRPLGVRAPAVIRGTGLASTAASSTANGTVSVKLSIQIVSTIATSVPITCGANVTVSESFASKAVLATRTSATAATCTVVLPYTLNFDSSYPAFSATYYVYYGQIEPVGSGAAGEVDSEFVIASSVPSNGTTTSYSGTTRL
jgi:hypothetical protein